MWFRVGQIDIQFGKLEFCLVTGLQFGTIPTSVVRGYEDVEGGVLDRCFDGKVPTFHMILNRLDEGNFDKSDDAIKLSYLFNPENAMGDIPEISKDDVMVSESDKELLSESVTREMKSNANQDRRKKKTYTVDPQETVATDMWEKLFAQVTDQISAAEKWMTESFTWQFDILLEEVRSQRNAPYTRSPKRTSIYDDHHDWGNLSDGAFPDHDSTKDTVDTYPAPKLQHMESAPQGDVNHTEAGLRGGVLDECLSPIPNIEIKNADLSVESIGKKQFQMTSQERKRKRKPSAKLQTPYTHPRPLYSRANPQMNHTISLKEFVKPGPKIFVLRSSLLFLTNQSKSRPQGWPLRRRETIGFQLRGVVAFLAPPPGISLRSVVAVAIIVASTPRDFVELVSKKAATE
ncbi:hypothetical protein LWI29_033750 [Acer saccharum]|uniref:Uncharacterized protein n=1 Tax=Acer saccharum TaxID=4024 RepID=A0AA39VLX1_ACESA|nr:hypothetical protein LWI29_033750 [Acer saccharum]